MTQVSKASAAMLLRCMRYNALKDFPSALAELLGIMRRKEGTEATSGHNCEPASLRPRFSAALG